MYRKSIISITLLASALLVQGQEQSILSNIPGAQTATGIMASSVDGMSRYFAPDGPIQPALTAIGALPLRGTELINNGITRISSGLNSGAQSLSRSAGNDGSIRMPGMETIRQSMPISLATMGSMMRSAIQGKNSFIRGQAEAGVQSGERLRSMMQKGLQSRRRKRDVSDAAASQADPLLGEATMMMGHGGHEMMSGMQNTMKKGVDQIKSQLQQSMSGHMDRMQSMHGIGGNMMNQAQGLTRTLSSGISGAMEHLQRTGQQMHQQLQGGLKQNMGAMSGMMGSMHGSMGNMGQNMQKNVQGVLKTAQSAAQQVTSQLQQAVSGPLGMLQNMGGSLSSLMQGKMGGGSGGSSGGSYGGGRSY